MMPKTIQPICRGIKALHKLTDRAVNMVPSMPIMIMANRTTNPITAPVERFLLVFGL